MTRNPGSIIACAVVMLLSTTTYIVRMAEGPAAAPHSKYIWNQMWVTLTQATTGYGESVKPEPACVPIHHLARASRACLCQRATWCRWCPPPGPGVELNVDRRRSGSRCR